MITPNNLEQIQQMADKAANGETFHITKTPTDEPMNGFMVTTRHSIPATLRESVLFIETPDDLPENIQSNLRFTDRNHAERFDAQTGDWEPVKLPQILTQAVENGGQFMACDTPMLIKYEPTNELESGVGTWPKTNWATTTYQDDNGGWHNIPQTLETALIHDQIPKFAQGGDVQLTDTGYEVHTSWGSVSTGDAGNAYLIRYNDDIVNEETKETKPNLNILTRTEESVDTYSVCDERGVPICGLREFDDMVQAKLEQTKQAETQTPTEEKAQPDDILPGMIPDDKPKPSSPDFQTGLF